MPANGFGMALADHHRSTAGVGQHVSVRFATVAGIERDADHIGGGRPAEEVDRLEGVVFEHADSVAGF